jgi:parallel beta-helix repeat protein
MRKLLPIAILFLCASGTLAADRLVPGVYPTIQAAIDAANPGDTVIVDPCTYYENVVMSGEDIILTSTDPCDPCVVAATIIDGNNAGTVVWFQGIEGPSCHLTGFTITNGLGDPYSGGVRGGGTQATISHCVITGNTATLSGGGGAYWTGTIRNCIISNNSADFGGGVHLCQNATFENCLIVGNTATDTTGGGLNQSTNVTLVNCTIADNSATTTGGGLSDFAGGSITNCILWGNTAPTGPQFHQLLNSPDPTYSCVQGGMNGTGNSPLDPCFVGADDYHLAGDSPCIDTGTNSPPSPLPRTDLDGNP